MRQANKKGGQPASTNRHVPKIHEERNADSIARREGKSKMTITQIEQLTYEEALKISVETMEIKEHQIVFANCGEYFKHSALVFKDGKHIYHANDYELHHGYIVKEEGIDALRQWYIDTLNNKLFTDSELFGECNSYSEYEKKCYFVRNYYIMRYDYRTAWAFGREQNEELEKEKKNYKFFNPVSFCYVNDESIAERQAQFLKHLESEYEKLKNSIEVFREMVSAELANHEACITCDYTEALSALGLSFENLTEEQQQIVKTELRKQINNYCC